MSFFNFIKVITYPLLSLVFPTKVYRKENFARQKSVVCCNHYGAMDIVVLSRALLWGGCHCVSKEELFSNKFVAWFLTKMGAIAIKRGESDIGAYRQIMQVLNEGKQLVIFPEGTRNSDPCGPLQPLQTGAATFAIKGSCPIIPIVSLRKPKPFRRTYLMVGEPIDVGQFSGISMKEARAQATALLTERMLALRADLEEEVASRKTRKEKKCK